MKSREFFYLGQYVGMSIAQDGNGIPLLAKQVYSYIVTEKYTDFKVEMCDIPDGTLKFAVEKVKLILIQFFIVYCAYLPIIDTWF